MLLEVLKQAGLQGTARSSTTRLARVLHCSQQTVSRQLRELEARSLLLRRASPLGVELSLSPQGQRLLQGVYTELCQSLQASGNPCTLSGTVETGLMEGAYYLSLPPYQRQLSEKLGFPPFKGTLNLHVNETDLHAFLAQAKPLHVEGFQSEERSFGGLKAYRVLVNGKIPAALIHPDRTTHKNVAEVIAEKKLRDQLGLKDGDRVSLTLQEESHA